MAGLGLLDLKSVFPFLFTEKTKVIFQINSAKYHWDFHMLLLNGEKCDNRSLLLFGAPVYHWEMDLDCSDISKKRIRNKLQKSCLITINREFRLL